MPKSRAGGKLTRKLDGGWVEEYKPRKSTRLHQWLQDAKEGKVFNGQKHKTKTIFFESAFTCRYCHDIFSLFLSIFIIKDIIKNF